MKEFEFKPAKGSVKKSTRKGRGNSSGKGGESGRGHKGQKSRTGYSRRTGFEGGQIPLYRRLPKKRGIGNKLFQESICVVNLNKLETFFQEGDVVDAVSLGEKGFVKTKRGVKIKILGTGEITKKLIVHAHYFSKTALEKLKSCGGSVNQLSER